MNNNNYDDNELAGEYESSEMGDSIDRAIEKAKREGKFIPKNLWEILRKRKDAGLWEGEIETLVPKEIVNMTSGAHYYVLTDARKRIITCTSCEVKHGGILEAHLLTHYRIEDGILYLDDQAINTKPLTNDKKE